MICRKRETGMKQTILFACLAIVGLVLLIVSQLFSPNQGHVPKRNPAAASTREKNEYRAFETEFELMDAVDEYLLLLLLLEEEEQGDSSQLFSTFGPFEQWNVSLIRNFANLFNGNRNPLATQFNGNVSAWDVSNAEYMHDMFHNATMFNGNLGDWQVSRVRTFNGMFEGATSFRGYGLPKWNVSSGELFMVMFAETSKLKPDLDLRHWNLRHAQDCKAMFRRSNFGQVSPQNSLCHWRQQLNASAAEVFAMFLESNCPQTEMRPSVDLSEAGYFCGSCPAVSNARRPNILFLVTDQQRFDTIRRTQDELWYFDNVTKIETPNLDALSRRGAYFSNVYCQCSVCAPARATLRTGCTIERTGIQNNDLIEEYRFSDLFRQRVESIQTLDQLLQTHGSYASEYYGKWHLPTLWWQGVSYNDYDQENATFSFAEDDVGPKFNRFLAYHERQGHISTDVASAKEGMQRDTFTGYFYQPIPLDSRYQYPTDTSLSSDEFEGWQRTQASVLGRSALNESYTNTYFIADAALRALDRLLTAQQQKDDADPFFLTVSFHNPHPPMVPATKHLQYYRNRVRELFVSHNLYDPMNNTAYRHFSASVPKYRNRKRIQEWTALYYALIAEIDEWIGVILAKLDSFEGARDNTLIVFTSDHGELLGAHGNREKNMFYEEAARVPLFVVYPGAIPANTSIDRLTSHLDIVATILDYAGLSDVDTSDGSSLRPIIENKSYNQDYDEDIVVAEWDFRKPIPTFKATLDRPIDERPALMVRKGNYKLLMQKKANSSQMDMMFDLEHDPFEMHNLLGINAPTASAQVSERAEHLRCLLLEWMERMDGDEKFYSDPAANFWEGNGDIWEIRHRQTWPALDVWSSHSGAAGGMMEFGPPVWNGTMYVRNEYLYLGTRTSGTLEVTVKFLVMTTNDTEVNENARSSSSFPFQLSMDGDPLPETLTLVQKKCNRIKVAFASPTMPTSTTTSVGLLLSSLGDTSWRRTIAISFAAAPNVGVDFENAPGNSTRQ